MAATKAERAERLLKRAIKRGLTPARSGLIGDVETLSRAATAGILTDQEVQEVRQAHVARSEVIAVDAFRSDTRLSMDKEELAK